MSRLRETVSIFKEDYFSKDYPKKVTDAYFRTALYTSTDDDGNPLDDRFTIKDLSKDCYKKFAIDFKKFIQMTKQKGINIYDLDPEDLGHNFFLTRNYHGSGFWDGDYEEETGKILTDISHKFGETYFYVGDDEKIYC
jgi:hypothetical protein